MASLLRPASDEPRTRLKLVTIYTPTRLAMIEAIRATPGMSASETARAIGRHPATMWANVHLLIQARLVRAERDGRKLRLYPVGTLSKHELFLARLGPSATVYEAITSGVPGRPVPIAHACGITRHAARYHLNRLARLGAIQSVERRILVTERTFVAVDGGAG